MDSILFPFLHGLILAFGLILPLGPQNTFVFNQGAVQISLLRALPVVVVASTCDTLLILLAVSGVSVIVITVPLFQKVLIFTGILFLSYIGWLTWRNEPDDKEEIRKHSNKKWSLKRQILFTMSISLLNPHAILDTIGIIGTSATTYQKNDRLFFTLACISVSWLWFLGLIFLGRFFGNVLIIRQYLPRISALIIWLSAVYLACNFMVI